MTAEVPPTPSRVLAVVAHPDDIEFMAGGTIARWAAAGAEITYCILTDGAAGSRDPSMTNARLAALRQQEQRAAAAACGVHNVIFLGYPDGRLEPTLAVRFAIARVIRQVRPEVVITNDPTLRWSSNFGYINHPDHIAAGEATLAAIMPTANTRLAAPELLAEGLEPHDVSHVYLASWGNANVYIPLTEEDLGRKIAALREHHSQLGDWAEAESMVREWAGRTAEMARAHGIDCAFAEGFLRITLRQPDARKQEEAAETPEAAESAVETAATT
jgi:LmbE family N-acetylglucosaminyl deacetylase